VDWMEGTGETEGGGPAAPLAPPARRFLCGNGRRLASGSPGSSSRGRQAVRPSTWRPRGSAGRRPGRWLEAKHTAATMGLSR
jgi:hypothetical protein